MALDILRTPGSSSSVERLISRAKIDVSPLRRRLNPELFAFLQIMKGWWNFMKDLKM